MTCSASTASMPRSSAGMRQLQPQRKLLRPPANPEKAAIPQCERVTAPQKSPEFRSDIEGLRAVAVLLVVACHCGVSWCRGGFIGVDVFFVLSGYLITGLLMAEIRRTSRLDLPRFYARRARRLLPALLLVLLATLAAGELIQGPQELEFAGRAARATALYISNVFFDHNAADYFAPDVESNPFLHTWSLGVEEQFYLVWPLLLLLGMQRRRSNRPLIWLLAGVASLSLLFCIWSTAHRPTLAFYELPARAWEFGLGGLLACAGVSTLRGATASLLGWLGLAAILVAAYVLRDGAGFPGWLATIPALGTVAVLSAGPARSPYGVGLLLDSPPMQYLGARSYSWYLWHWPFIVLAAAMAPGIPVVGKVLVRGRLAHLSARRTAGAQASATHTPNGAVSLARRGHGSGCGGIRFSRHPPRRAPGVRAIDAPDHSRVN